MPDAPSPDHSMARRAAVILRAFAPALWQNRRALAGSYILGFLAVAVALLAPWPLKILIDSVLGARPMPWWIDQVAAGLSSARMVLILAAATALIALVAALLSAIQRMIDARVRERMALALRDRTLAHAQRLSLMLGTNDRSGELVLRLIDDSRQVVKLLTKSAPLIFRHMTTVLATLAVMGWLDIRVGLLGLAVLVILSWLARHHAEPLAKAAMAKRRAEGAVAGLAQEILRGMTSVRALGAEATVRERFRAGNAESLRAGVDETRFATVMERDMQIASGLAMALVIGVGGLLVVDGELTIGTLTVITAYMLQLLKPVEKINELASAVARGLARGEHLLALLNRVPDIQERPGAIDIVKAEGHLTFDNVSFAYPASNPDGAPVPVLEAVNLCLERGSLTVLVGPSGSGKSTLIGLMLRLFDPTHGEIRLDGTPFPDLTLASLRAQFAVMVQDTYLFAGTLREAICTTGMDHTDADLWAALDLVALTDDIRALPDGLDSRLGENAGNLSGGQRARLSLVRALLLDRPFLLLDEPLANVDPASQDIILAALADMRATRTCLAVTHQMALTDQADVVLRLQARRLVPVPRLLAASDQAWSRERRG